MPTQPDPHVHPVRQRRLLLPEPVLQARARAAQGATSAPVTNEGPGCPAQGNGSAWNHGDIQPPDRHHLAGLGGTGDQEPRRDLRDLDRPRRRPADADDAPRPRDDYSLGRRPIAQILERPLGPGEPGRSEPRGRATTRSEAACKQLDAPFGSSGWTPWMRTPPRWPRNSTATRATRPPTSSSRPVRMPDSAIVRAGSSRRSLAAEAGRPRCPAGEAFAPRAGRGLIADDRREDGAGHRPRRADTLVQLATKGSARRRAAAAEPTAPAKGGWASRAAAATLRAA